MKIITYIALMDKATTTNIRNETDTQKYINEGDRLDVLEILYENLKHFKDNHASPSSPIVITQDIIDEMPTLIVF